MRDLESEAGLATLETLEDLWRARWGDAWVKRSEITADETDYYDIAATRLNAAGKLETHDLYDCWEKVLRLK